MTYLHFVNNIKRSYPHLGDKLKLSELGYLIIEAGDQCVEEAVAFAREKDELWASLTTSIKEELGFREIRQAASAPHIHGVIFYINADQSIILTINHLFKIIAAYFDYYGQTNTQLPVKGAGTKAVSFFPYTTLQAETTINIADIFLYHFPDYKLFNNVYAPYPIEGYRIDGYEWKGLTLYQVLYNTDLHCAI